MYSPTKCKPRPKYGLENYKKREREHPSKQFIDEAYEILPHLTSGVKKEIGLRKENAFKKVPYVDKLHTVIFYVAYLEGVCALTLHGLGKPVFVKDISLLFNIQNVVTEKRGDIDLLSIQDKEVKIKFKSCGALFESLQQAIRLILLPSPRPIPTTKPLQELTVNTLPKSSHASKTEPLQELIVAALPESSFSPSSATRILEPVWISEKKIGKQISGLRTGVGFSASPVIFRNLKSGFRPIRPKPRPPARLAVVDVSAYVASKQVSKRLHRDLVKVTAPDNDDTEEIEVVESPTDDAMTFAVDVLRTPTKSKAYFNDVFLPSSVINSPHSFTPKSRVSEGLSMTLSPLMSRVAVGDNLSLIPCDMALV